MIAVAAGAVCVPLNPGFTDDEYQRYFGELHLAALLTRADLNSASRRVAHILGIPIIDLSTRPNEGAGAFSIVGQAPQRVVDDEFASSADDAFILLTSGSTSRPKTVPLTHASVCLSAYNVCAALALGSRDRLLSVLPLFHGHGLISGLLAALAAGSSVVCTPGFDATEFFGWLTEFRPTWYTAVPAIHRALLSAAGSPQADRTAVLLAARSFGFYVSTARSARRTGSPVWCPCYRHLRHDGSRHPDCRKSFAAAKAWFSRPAGRGRDRDSGQRGSTITIRQTWRDRAAGSHYNQGLRQ